MNNNEFTYISLSKITLYQTRLLHLTDHNHKDQAIEAGKNPKFGNHPSGSQGGRSPAPAPLFAAMRRQSRGFTVSSFRPPLPCSTTPFHVASTGRGQGGSSLHAAAASRAGLSSSLPTDAARVWGKDSSEIGRVRD